MLCIDMSVPNFSFVHSMSSLMMPSALEERSDLSASSCAHAHAT